MKQDKLKATARLLEIMDTLREQCPWDRKQTFETLRNNTIEETYELADAILNKDLDGIKEEAGDFCCTWFSMPSWARRPGRSIMPMW